jgi:hypothetical protein
MHKREFAIRVWQLASHHSNERLSASKALKGAIPVNLSNRHQRAFVEEAEDKYRLSKTGETAIQ